MKWPEGAPAPAPPRPGGTLGCTSQIGPATSASSRRDTSAISRRFMRAVQGCWTDTLARSRWSTQRQHAMRRGRRNARVGGRRCARALCAPGPDRPRAHERWSCAFTSPPWHRCYKSISAPRRLPSRCPWSPMTNSGGRRCSMPSSQSHCPERATRARCARTGRHAHAHYACCYRCNRHPRGPCTPHCLLACLLPRRAMRRRRASALSTAPPWGVQSLARRTAFMWEAFSPPRFRPSSMQTRARPPSPPAYLHPNPLL